MAEIHGKCDKRFDAVRAALAENLDSLDVGASAAVFLDGEPVVDIWGGYADADRTVPWERDTITCVFSVSKTMLALCALILADRGSLDLDAPVAKYWPEFAAEGAADGKDRVLVKHVLSHTSGLPDFDEPVPASELYDWSAVTDRLAAQAPAWEPGTESGYHSITQGFLLGEVIRRITDRDPGVFFAEEIAGPLGVDFHFGLPAEHDERVAPMIVPPDSPSGDWVASAESSSQDPGPAVVGIRVSDANTVAWRRAQILSANGIGNARSVAAIQSVVACGGIAGETRLLSAAGCEVARKVQYQGLDRILGREIQWAMGYGMFGRAIGWGGWGGSLVIADLDARMSVAYVMNQMLDGATGGHRGLGIVVAAYEGLG